MYATKLSLATPAMLAEFFIKAANVTHAPQSMVAPATATPCIHL